MKKKRFILFVFSILSFYVNVNGQSSALAKMQSAPCLKHALTGVSIVDLKTGKSVVSEHADIVMAPASVLKTVTTATALKLYPSDHRFKTHVSYTGSITPEGTLTGDLILRGGGDPTLASEYSLLPKGAFAERVVASLKKAGIKRIAGDIVGDESIYGSEGVSPDWLWEDLGNYFASGIYGLNYGDNTFQIVLNTSQSGKKPAVKQIRPEIPNLTIQNQLLPKSMSFDSCYIYGAPYSNERYLYGAVPHTKSEFVVKGDVPEPALFAAQQVKNAIEASTIAVDGKAYSYRQANQSKRAAMKSGKELLVYQSDPLSQIVKVVNYRSNNLYAEALLRLIAQKNGGNTSAEGVEAVKRYWKTHLKNPDALLMYDGSGLSPKNKVSPAFLSEMLVQMKDDNVFRESLPKAGVEGTVASFLKQTPYAGKARLKSGSISQVIAYAGYLQGAKSEYAVVVMVNGHGCKASQVRKALEKYLLELDL